MAIEVDLYYSDPKGIGSKAYQPPKGLPFESKGSYEADKREYKKSRATFYRMTEGLWKEGIIEKAEQEDRKLVALDRFFSFRDSFTIMADTIRAKKKK